MAKQKKKNNKILITCLVVLLLGIVTAIGVYFILNKNHTEEHFYTPECTKKGNTCTPEEIENGVLVSYQVNDKEFYNFYVINNDENEMTLIMDNNIKDNIDWDVENINIKGPVTALSTLNELTSSWTNVNKINSYTYEDYGKLSFENNCSNNTVEPLYDCTNEEYSTRGYKSINIENGYLKLNYNLPQDEVNENTLTYLSLDEVRARLITIEELNDVINNYNSPVWLINNLKENAGYWTLSSSTAFNVNYSFGAYGVANNEGTISVESIQTKNDKNTITMGIRPVIKVNKV